jgi:hypothetical protein
MIKADWRSIGVRLAFGGYAGNMNINPVITCTLIIRSQVEYSIAAQEVIVRCILEKSATGQRRGFTDVEVLLTALRAELLALQNQMIPPEEKNLKKSVATVADDTTITPAPLTADHTPDPSQTIGSAEGRPPPKCVG